MESKPSRNYLIFSEKTDTLDELLPTRTSKMEYDTDRYNVHFKSQISPNAVKNWSGCQNVEPVFKQNLKFADAKTSGNDDTMKSDFDNAEFDDDAKTKIYHGCQYVEPVVEQNLKFDDTKTSCNDDVAMNSEFDNAEFDDDAKTKIYRRILQSKQKYEDKIARGRLLAEILNDNNIPEDILDGADRQAYRLYKKIKDLEFCMINKI